MLQIVTELLTVELSCHHSSSGVESLKNNGDSGTRVVLVHCACCAMSILLYCFRWTARFPAAVCCYQLLGSLSMCQPALLLAMNSKQQTDFPLQFNVINYSAPWVCVSLLCAKPLERLQGVQPPKRIMASPLLAPLLLIGSVFALQQALAQYALRKQPWYQATTDQVRQLT